MGRLAVPYWKQLGRLPTSFCSSITLTHGIVYISLTPLPVSVCPELSQHSTTPALSLPLSPFGITCSATYVPWYPRDLHKFHISPLDHNRLNITTLASLFDLSNYLLHRPLRSMCPKQFSTCATDGSARGYCSSFLHFKEGKLPSYHLTS